MDDKVMFMGLCAVGSRNACPPYLAGMRLTEQQRVIIHATVAKIFGAGAKVWLFGSRVDDNKRGGDIGLLIETEQVDVNAIV